MAIQWIQVLSRKPLKKLKISESVVFSDDLHAVLEAVEDGQGVFRFNLTGDDFDAALDAAGQMPLPPYIAAKRAADDRDSTDYQTVFATHTGAVAAPTASLHFDQPLLDRLATHGVNFTRVTLHVGAGTFLPVDVADTEDHRMHSEYGEVSADAAERINAAPRVVAVGTTVLRILESAAGANGVLPFAGETDIFITPGFRFRVVDRLLTNFHLPRSTLFMLVSAFAGLERMQAAYAHAIAERYRFYSYGDACLLSR